MRLVLSGYYGFRNSGDEAVLLSILSALEQAGREQGVAVTPVVLSGDPEWTSRQYGVEAVPRMKLGAVRAALRASDGLISGGGSLLQDATGMGSIPYYLGIMALARWCGKPVFVYAQGIGPVNRAIFRGPIARAFRKAAYVSVRDEESAALLQRFGVPAAKIDVVPDPVMGLPLPMSGAAEGAPERPAPEQAGLGVDSETDQRGSDRASDDMPLIGVSVRFWRSDRADLDRVAEALNALAARRKVRLRFLPLYRGADEEASRYVMERLGSGVAAELAPAHDEPQEMLREVGRCKLLLGMRLHSLIYAANREVPLVGLSYDPKIDHFLARLGEQAIGSTDALAPDHFSDRVMHMLDHSADWLAAVRPKIDRLRQEVRRPAQQIAAYPRIYQQ